MNAVFLAFERATIFGLAALLVALCAQWMLNGRVPAAWRVWLWRAALLQSALALVPLAPLRLAVFRPVQPVAPSVSVSESAPQLPVRAPSAPIVSTPASASQDAPATVAPLEVVPAPRDMTPVETVRAPRLWDWRLFLLGFYVLGFGVQLGMLARSFRRVRQTLRACTPVENDDVRAQARQIAQRMNIGSNLPRLLQTQNSAPFLTGVLRPAIVLSSAILTPQNPASEPVLAHELAHLKRRDLVWNALLWLVQTLLWFHPLVWVARRFLALETESACDEIVLSATRVAPKFYGALLLNTMNNSQTPLAVGVNDGFFALKTRLERLNQTPKCPNKAARIIFVAALCAAFGALVPLRFVARAQVAAPVTPTLGDPVSGVVRDQKGAPVVGATVYAMKLHTNAAKSLETVTSGANGTFAFSPKVQDHSKIELFVDAGRNGFGQVETYQSQKSGQALVMVVAPPSQVTLRLEDSRHHPVVGKNVMLWHLETPTNEWVAVPYAVYRKLMWGRRTDAHGIATFPALPQGMTAQFSIGSRFGRAALSGANDANGREFAPLSTSKDSVVLNAPLVNKTIQLLLSLKLQGRVFFPGGRLAKGVNITAYCLDETQSESRADSGKRNRDWPIWTMQMFTDADGRYSFVGLRPGRYRVGAYLEKPLSHDWVGPLFQRTLTRPTNQINLPLTRGGLLQGVVVSQKTGQPLKGQFVTVADFNDQSRGAKTDERGFFRFRVLAGKTDLFVFATAPNAPTNYSSPDVHLALSIKDGEKHDFKIKLPVAPAFKPTTGTVVGPDGKPVPNAGVIYRMAGSHIDSQLHRVQADANGRFLLPPRWSVRPSQLWATSGESTTTRSTIALAGNDVTLHLQANGWASVAGKVHDDKGNLLEGVKVWAYTIMGGTAGGPESLTTSGGRFQFGRLFPGAKVAVIAKRKGYVGQSMVFDTLKAGTTCFMDVSMKTANAKLAGRVVAADGTPAILFHVEGATTKSDGRFFLPEIPAGPNTLYVYSPKNDRRWGPYGATGKEAGIVFRLTEAKREKGYGLPIVNRAKVATLAGKAAPEIKAAHWANGRKALLSSLRGQVVLLVFDNFTFGGNTEVEDIVPSFKGRVQVVGVQSSSDSYFPLGSTWSALDKLARVVPFPLALDSSASMPRGSDGRTSQIYGSASCVVIGRNGRVIYAGDQLDRAITFAATAK